MADNVAITAGSGTTIAADDIGAGVLAQRVKPVWGPDGTGNDIDVATGKPLPVQVRSATGLIPIGEPTDAAATATDTTSVSGVSLWKQISKTLQAAVASAAGAFFVKLHDGTTAALVKAASSGAAAASDPALVVTLRDVNSNGQAVMASSAPTTIASNQAWQTGMSPRSFVAAFTTLTRPANTTAYTAADSISDNATAGSVTALSATISDTNDDPITITDIIVNSTDTGLAGKKIRAYLFNSDPTASTGVGGGDNAAYSQKKAATSALSWAGWKPASLTALWGGWFRRSTKPTSRKPAASLSASRHRAQNALHPISGG
jgi:hypothetical protein